MEPQTIVMAALGRTLYPGMLYDCRSDNFIPGVTLWDKKALSDDTDVLDRSKTFVKIAASDSIGEKANLLNVSASLKASFLGGLVEVGGSAKYLQDSKSSARQCRVTMQFSQTTKFEQLTMKELGNITYPQVFEQKTATHVVTAALYGAQAFMVFDYNSSENENKQAVEGNLHAVIKKIPTITIEGQASLKLTAEEKKLAENLNVTFYGDYELDENPTTYTEAMRVCKKLPSLLKERKSKGVPITVWLYPLSLLNDKAANLVREISMSLVSKTETVLEELYEAGTKCSDLIKNPIITNFPELKERVQQFRNLHTYYKASLQKALFRILPLIRSGNEENKVLGDILSNHSMTPFTATHMNKWLDSITTEINVLISSNSGLKDIAYISSTGSLNSILFDPNFDSVVCLAFTSLKNIDPYLEAIQNLVNSEALENMERKPAKSFSFPTAQPWFMASDMSVSMRQNISLFTSFYKANINEKRFKFIIASISDPSNPGTSIRLYQIGALKNPKYQPVSKPAVPVVNEKAAIKLSKSPTGETVKFQIEYSTSEPTDSDKDVWQVVTISDARSSFTLTGIKPDEQHWVRYRAVNPVGVSEASDYVSFKLLNKDNFTITPWKISMTILTNQIRTKLMTNLGLSRWSASSIMSEVTDLVNSPAIPYTGTISRGLKVGMALYFQGVVVSSQKFFDINLIAGTKETGDVNMQMVISLNDSLSFNSKRSGKWDTNIERVTGCPLTAGSAFDIFFLLKNEGYEIYINGQKVFLYKHRLPVDKVTTLTINGDLVMNVVGTVPNWSYSTFGEELASGISRTNDSNIQSDVPYPVCNPKKNYTGKIPLVLGPGVALFFQGVVPSDASGLEINLKMMADIAFHFNPRFHSLALNSYTPAMWETQITYQECPFVKGGAFDILMFIHSTHFEIFVNGLRYCTFNHRRPIEKVDELFICNDIFVNNFSIIEISNFNVRAIIPANA